MIRDIERQADGWMRAGIAVLMAIEIARQEAERLAAAVAREVRR